MRPLREAVTTAASGGAATSGRAGPALVVEDGDDLTLGEWAARSDAVARGLLARGAGAGTRVALLFDRRRWADFAVAWLGVRKAGAGAVLLAAGAAAPDLARCLAHSGAVGLVLGTDQAGAPAGCAWVAGVGELERDRSRAPVTGATAPADVVYDAAPLAPPRPWSGPTYPLPAGELVHAWAPGSASGQAVLRSLLAGRAAAAAAPAAFDPDRLCRLATERRASVLGLTPALAAALLASGATRRHDLSSVSTVALSGPPSAGLRARLHDAFAGAEVDVLAPAVEAPVAGAPVAVSQEAMLWHEQFAPGSFNLPCLVRRYRGPLDVAAWVWALRELVRRHEPLRSSFAMAGGHPVQVVGDRIEVAYDDFGGLPAGERDARVAELLAAATARPFDLTAGPLFEPRILRLGEDDHLLVVRLHHTVFDDWSVDVFRRELSALYGARLTGTPSPLVEPATTFTAASRRRPATADDAQRAWWRQELDGAPLAVQLPLAGAGAGPGPEPAEPLRVELAPEVVAGLRALAPRLRATPFQTVLTAFSVLVSRVTGQRDLVLATVVAHRETSDVEPLIGCFTKKVPVRLRLDGDPTFSELTARTRGSLLGALAHQDVAFEAAVQEGLGRPATEHGVVPQIAVVFQAEAPQRVRLRLPGIAIGPYDAPPAARAERHFSAGAAGQVWGDGIYLGTFLILSLAETEAGMALIARGVFDRAATGRLLADFQALLVDVVTDPEQRVGSPVAHAPADVVNLRGFRFSRSRIEAALRRCPGVAGVSVEVRDDRLVADVVAGAGGPPAPAMLRRTLWSTLPGAPWPSVFLVDGVALDDGPSPSAGTLTAMWAEIAGRSVAPQDSYWQDFTFLEVLAEGRAAGLALPDAQVVRCRTPEMLAVLPWT